jgi:hypothetical protein
MLHKPMAWAALMVAAEELPPQPLSAPDTNKTAIATSGARHLWYRESPRSTREWVLEQDIFFISQCLLQANFCLF